MSSIIRATTTSGLQVAPDNSGSLQLQTNGTTAAVTIDTSQNVGIGTTSPCIDSGWGALTIKGTTGADIFFQDSTGTSTYSSSQGFITTGSANFSMIALGASRYLQFATNGTERMRIDSSGNVLLNTTSFGGTAHKQVISTTSDYQLALQATDTTNGFATLSFFTGSTLEAQIYYYKTNDRLYVVNSSAGVYLANAGTSWTSNSDERKKDIIEPITNAINKVSTLRAVIGKFKTDEEGTRRAFLIAQDVQAVLPEAVDASNPDDLGVQYTETIPLLVAAIKEQQTIINDLKARIETLEAK